MTTAHINAIGTAVPPHDVHQAFNGLVGHMLTDRRSRAIYDRMARRSGIESRYSCVEAGITAEGEVIDPERFYRTDDFPTTKRRMERYAQAAPDLAMQAIERLDPDIASRDITHVIVASCTGFLAPGLDQILIRRAGIAASAERTLVGFMGCYAAVNALRLARHTVRSEPDARVLVVNVELCTLHLQETQEVDKLLAMLLFSDGASAALVTAEAKGIALGDFRAAAIDGSQDLITWHIGDHGFVMHLDGQVPIRIADALKHERVRNDDAGLLRGHKTSDFDLWAVHAGGRSILDAVEKGFELPPEALHPSRSVLRRFGNMSSATLMFVLADMLAQHGGSGTTQDGMAMAFGPGLAAETFRFAIA
ncbi:type III polyketide synthase [Novosphingobium aquimarinum]|uniref:type III polyketide synthase n=1 Tax=Novosphingobium aquimarinum TaxID=2682494 RepID=UPI0012EBB71D|nr:type III polyketide synthase [Novosphingobium aquimarinum]